MSQIGQVRRERAQRYQDRPKTPPALQGISKPRRRTGIATLRDIPQTDASSTTKRSTPKVKEDAQQRSNSLSMNDNLYDALSRTLASTTASVDPKQVKDTIQTLGYATAYAGGAAGGIIALPAGSAATIAFNRTMEPDRSWIAPIYASGATLAGALGTGILREAMSTFGVPSEYTTATSLLVPAAAALAVKIANMESPETNDSEPVDAPYNRDLFGSSRRMEEPAQPEPKSTRETSMWERLQEPLDFPF